jgi:hypothetical protein
VGGTVWERSLHVNQVFLSRPQRGELAGSGAGLRRVEHRPRTLVPARALALVLASLHELGDSDVQCQALRRGPV